MSALIVELPSVHQVPLNSLQKNNRCARNVLFLVGIDTLGDPFMRMLSALTFRYLINQVHSGFVGVALHFLIFPGPLLDYSSDGSGAHHFPATVCPGKQTSVFPQYGKDV